MNAQALPDAVRKAPRPLPPAVIICGPTAAGKTEFGLALAERFPIRLVSADSVQVYRGMDIGTAKPDPETLRRFPHALIDIRDPAETYSAAEFAHDAAVQIAAAQLEGQLPVIVGGTPLYLRALRYGLDAMPPADPGLRARIDAEAAERGWPALHRRLAELDPESGRRIRASDRQRVQRALELCISTGRPASSFQHGRGPDRLAHSLMLVIAPADRAVLHRRIEQRWGQMLELGLVDEVEELLRRPGVTRDSGAMRAVGYRQAVEYLDGALELPELVERATAATRQLAKRQLTAFRQWTGGLWYEPLNLRTIDRIITRVGRFRSAAGAGA